jgi:hypothetical protein
MKFTNPVFAPLSETTMLVVNGIVRRAASTEVEGI